MKILAIETSCDETACAIVKDGVTILSNVIASSAAMHAKYGGIVPEVAAREQLRCIIPVIQEALEPLESPETFHATPANEVIKRHIDAIAVTVGPGLIGSLLVGVETAKTIAFATGKPIIPVNHVIAHMYANLVESDKREVKSDKQNNIQFPAISLVVSGGHTELYLMKSVKDITWLGGTIDDAAGECLDKTARLLGFGHGGGAAIAAAAAKFPISPAERDPASRDNFQFPIKFPRPMINDETLNFSFSGLKTAVMREWKKYQMPSQSGSGLKKGQTPLAAAFAYEVQEAITDVLVEKTLRAAKLHSAKSILLSGGVAANLRLREKFNIHHSAFSIHVPPAQLCTDNAVAIAAAAYFLGSFTLSSEGPTDWHEITAKPDLSVENQSLNVA